ncbi:calcipressin-2-like [Oppia nitens]|uniref:calcipressin-2-like n=1 Tax=Oppia nitens TaxID=1686743 RepID=UPI0023D9A421|nr:calcipressin-2-like [Oppia nitens]
MSGHSVTTNGLNGTTNDSDEEYDEIELIIKRTLERMRNRNPNDIYLRPPTPDKQFLISPPASPPVGWHPIDEAHPVIDDELLSALNNLTPGVAHELHPQSESQPAIVVHICAEDDQQLNGQTDDSSDWKPKMKIQQTSRPGPVSQQSSSH